MCDPVSATVISIASSAASYVGQRQQARKQKRYQEEATEAENERLRLEQEAILTQQSQDEIAAARELLEVQKQSKENIGRARVAASEAGISGNAVESQLDSYAASLGRYEEAVSYQQTLDTLNTNLRLKEARQSSRQNKIRINQPINSPSAVEGITGMAAAGMQGYRIGADIKQTRIDLNKKS